MNKLLSACCDWCPRRCGANRQAGEQGECGIADTLRLARAALHFWEEPPISGKEGSGAVFFSGCSLHCAYCQNARISSGAVGKDIPFARLVEIYLELQAQGAKNINLVTPTHYAPVVIASLEHARSRGLALPVVWNTSGYETLETIRLLKGHVDVFLTDFKYYSTLLSARYSHASDYREVAAAALEEMLSLDDCSVIVRHLLLPGCLDESKALLSFLARRFGTSLQLSLMSQYTPRTSMPQFPELSSTVTSAEYEELLDYADKVGFDDYFWQEGTANLESFIPIFDCTGV